jgi:hypothetical protein
MEGILARNADQHVIEKYVSGRENEWTMLASFKGADVPRQAFQCTSEFRSGLAVKPPVAGILGCVFRSVDYSIAVYPNCVPQKLPNFREFPAHIILS